MFSELPLELQLQTAARMDYDTLNEMCSQSWEWTKICRQPAMKQLMLDKGRQKTGQETSQFWSWIEDLGQLDPDEQVDYLSDMSQASLRRFKPWFDGLSLQVYEAVRHSEGSSRLPFSNEELEHFVSYIVSLGQAEVEALLEDPAIAPEYVQDYLEVRDTWDSNFVSGALDEVAPAASPL